MRLLTIFALFASAPLASAQSVYYPAAAQAEGLAGRATVECLVGDNGGLTCAVTEEAPVDSGFGQAAIAMAEGARVAPRTRDGRSTAGGRVRVTYLFDPGPPARVTRERPTRGASH